MFSEEGMQRIGGQRKISSVEDSVALRGGLVSGYVVRSQLREWIISDKLSDVPGPVRLLTDEMRVHRVVSRQDAIPVDKNTVLNEMPFLEQLGLGDQDYRYGQMSGYCVGPRVCVLSPPRQKRHHPRDLH